MKIELGGKYTSNDKPVRILCVDAPGSHSVIGLIECQVQ